MFVSVIVPCYNHEPYLKDRLESIVNQTYQNFELILLDDLSPDNSAEILLSYQNHPKVSHCIINEKNSGSTFHQWNKGISLAKGELIWIAESDDVADLTFLEELVPQFEKNPNLTLAYSQSYRIDSTNKITGSWLDQTNDLNKNQFLSDFTMDGLDYIHKYLIVKNTIPNASAVIFKKQKYIDVGRANQNLKLVGDWAIWSKICAEGDIFYCYKKLNFFRYHSTSVIATVVNNSQHVTIRNEIIRFRTDLLTSLDLRAKIGSKVSLVLNKNKKLLFKDISQNASYAIRKREFKYLYPTIKLSIKSCPIYLLPTYCLKLILKLIYAFCIDLPIALLLKKYKVY